MNDLYVLLLIIGIPLCLFLSVVCRQIILHPFATVYYFIKDTVLYFAHKKWRVYNGGILNCYFAHFGGGKTLSLAHYIRVLFKKYNNKKVYDDKAKKWVLQKVHVISNVSLNGIPYEPLQSLSQIVCCAWRNKDLDKKNGTRTVVLVLLDEASAQLNSREFKTNINADFLNSLITCRHFHLSFFYSSQKFKLVDALMRSVTQRAIWCKKCWRYMVQYYYDADEMEYATNPTMVKPYRRKGFFIKDKDYNAYDTLATVDKLKKSVDKNDMMTDAEILALRGAINPDEDAYTPSRRLIKRRRKTA